MSEIQSTLSAIWLFLALHLWQTTIVLLPVLLLARFMRHAPARSLHWLWSIALAKTLIPFAAVSALLRAAGVTLPGEGWSGADATATSTLATVHAVLYPDPIVQIDVSGVGGAIALLLSVVWLAGVLYGVTRLSSGSGSRIREGGPALLEAAERERLEAARAAASIPSDRLRVLDAPCIPHVRGIIRPSIRVPRSIIAQLDHEELLAVLIHEEAHRRRRDPARALMHKCFAIALFFYPPIRVVLRSLHEATEWLCDEQVLRAGIEPAVYGRALAKTIRMGLFPIAQPSAAGARGGSKLRARFDRISDPGRFSNMKRHTILLASVLVLFAAAALIPSPIIAGDAGGAVPGKSAQEKDRIELDKMPVMIPKSYIQPVYPEQERKDGIQGMVMLMVGIKKDGSVGAVKPVQEVDGHPAFTESAMKAVAQWRFEPGEKDGKAVDCEVHIPIKFALDSGDKKDSSSAKTPAPSKETK